MNFDEYDIETTKTAIYPGSGEIIGLAYAVLGLNGEAGEVAEKVKKYLRDGVIEREDVLKELGDVLWYLSAASREMGYTLDEVAEANLKKLQSRKDRNKLQGSGDNR